MNKMGLTDLFSKGPPKKPKQSNLIQPKVEKVITLPSATFIEPNNDRHDLTPTYQEIRIPPIATYTQKNIPYKLFLTKSPIENLDSECKQFYRYIKPTTNEQQRRIKIFQDLKQSLVLIPSFNEYTLHMFGSSVHGLHLPKSDIDLVIISQTPLSSDKQLNLLKLIKYQNFIFMKSMQLITAKIPLLQYYDNLKVDLSIGTLQTLGSLQVSNRIKNQLPGVCELYLILKQFLNNRALDSNAAKGIGGYGLLLWVAAFVRIHEIIYSEEINWGLEFEQEFRPLDLSKDLKNDYDVNVGVLFLHFLHFFGYCFDYDRLGLAPGGYNGDPDCVLFSRDEVMGIGCGFILCLLDPNDSKNVVTKNGTDIAVIVCSFRQAYDVLLRELTHDSVCNRGFLRHIMNIPGKNNEGNLSEKTFNTNSSDSGSIKSNVSMVENDISF